jgi:hypothetical protein
MPISSEDLGARFDSELTAIAAKLVRAFRLRHSLRTPHLSDPLLRWLDFADRYIPPRPRHVLLSSLFPKRLPDEVAQSLQTLVRRLEDGDDTNGHQGEGLTKRSDISAPKDHRRTDLLWADWGIHHLHISPPRQRGYVARSGWLLFCRFEADQVALIDVRPHGKNEAFADPSLIEQLLKDWPDYMEQFRMRGILTGEVFTDQQIHELRRAGINTPVQFAGACYIGPGMGITTAGTPTRVTMASGRIRLAVRRLSQLVMDPQGQFSIEMTKRQVANPAYSLELTERGLVVYEAKSTTAFTLPRDRAENDMGRMHAEMIPDWCLARIRSELKKNGPPAPLGSPAALNSL